MSSLMPPESSGAMLVLLADHDQPSGAGEHDVVDALPQGGARGDHLESPQESGFLP